jgi:hypothetical protein
MAAWHDKYVMPHINAPLRRFWSALVLVLGPLVKMRLKRKRHGLDDSDPRRDLYRTRD